VNGELIDSIILEDIDIMKKDLKKEDLNGKRVLITGGAGFLGSWLCDVLLGLKAEVTCVDNMAAGLLSNLDHLLDKPKFEYEKADVCAFTGKGKFDYILHMASRASPDEYQTKPVETLRANSLGSANMAELARKHDATFLLASTSEIYGDAQVVPTPETYWGNVNPIGPRSCYDEGKRFAEALLAAYHKQYGTDVRIARIFNTFGPRLREDGLYGRAVSRFINCALKNAPIPIYGDGTQTRSFCYVTDTITALVLLTLSQTAKAEVMNVGNPQEITILQLAEKIRELVKSRSQLTFHSLPKDDPKRRCPEISKIKKMLEWMPKTSLEEGLRRTIAWFQARVA